LLSTSADDIRNKINASKGKLVIISTYQSAIELQIASDDIQFDLGVFDEAHKTVGQVGKQFSAMLTDENMVITNRLFMTATPKIYVGDDNDIISMNNSKFYGEKIYCYNTRNAINDKKLTDYQMVTMVATNQDIQNSIKVNKLVQYEKEFTDKESTYLGTILMLLKKFHDGTVNHMITYHNTVNRATKFKEFLIKINDLMYSDEDIMIDSLDGSMTIVVLSL
jgi:predicted helicase